jgi:hypothetical protein
LRKVIERRQIEASREGRGNVSPQPKNLAVTDLVTAETTSSLTSALALHFG